MVTGTAAKWLRKASTPHLHRAGNRRELLRAAAEQIFLNETSGHYYADAPVRRRKTRQELIDGHEFIELHDRAFPGKLAGRSGT